MIARPASKAAMGIELRHLRLVVAVAERGSLTRAGADLHLTQSALSHQLRGLESDLGARLFQRIGRRMQPTAAGERLLATAKQTLKALAEAENETRLIAAGRDGVIRFTMQCYTCYQWLPPLLARFQLECPRVEVQIVADTIAKPLVALRAGRLDLAVSHEPVLDRRLESVPLFEDELLAVLPKGHRLARRAFVTAQDFLDEQLFVYFLPASGTVVFRDFLTPAGVTPRQVTQVQLTEAALDLVRAGAGVSVLPRWLVLPHLVAGDLVAVKLTEHGVWRRWRAVFRRSRETPPYLLAFARLLVAGPGALVSVRGPRLAPRATANARVGSS
jgi:LysR family transcriptional regulator for metE and metH